MKIRTGIVLLAATLPIGLGGLYHATDSPSTCNQCHLIRPAYQSWQRSTHRKVNCTFCHLANTGGMSRFIEKVDKLSEVYTTLFGARTTVIKAVVPDSKCLSCHPRSKPYYRRIRFDGRVFSHALHQEKSYEANQLSCQFCHRKREFGDHRFISKRDSFCTTCHVKKGVSYP